MDVEWSEVTPHMRVDASIWLGWQDDALEIRDEGQTRGRLIDGRAGGGVLLSLGLFDWAQIGLELPFVLYQSGDENIMGINGRLSAIGGGGIGDFRLVPKVQVLSQEDFPLSLALSFGLTFPTSPAENYYGSTSAGFEPELLVGRRWNEALRTGLNVGFRVRKSQDLIKLSVNEEIFGRLGAGFMLKSQTGLPIELDTSLAFAFSAKDPLDDPSTNYLELLGGAAYHFEAQPLIAFAAAGAGLAQGFGTPDFRAVVGLRFTGIELDMDKDGIRDSVDECPLKPEDFDEFEDLDGCPDVDDDEDGVLDVDDGARLDPEDRDGFEDADGVPDPDNDQDGILDLDDDCPLVPGLAAKAGCPDQDSDGDGIMDLVDACPKAPEDMDNYADADGCPDPDNDDDGVLDGEDRCVLVPGVKDNQGCPDTDRDKDTVVDRLDNCPDEPGPPSNQGCKKKQLVIVVAGRLDILEKVYFKTASAKIRRRSYDLLDNVAAVISVHPEIKKVRIEGHTDDRGRDDTNMTLSWARAESVKAYLIAKGVEAPRLQAVGYGETVPLENNKTKKGRATNRRVDFVIPSTAKGVQQSDTRTLDIED